MVRRYVVLSLLAVALLASCGKDQGPVRDARAEAVATAAQRLQGKWLLTSFQPEVPLEPALQMLLNAQFNQFIVEFRGQSISGQGPGVTINRTYRMLEAYVDHFKATIYDSYGVGVDAFGDFSGDSMIVNGATAPWRGRATFRRVP